MAKQFSVSDGTPWMRRFFTIWGGQALSILGSQLVQFALIWHLTVKTGSATVLAIASLVGMLPAIVLGPFIGTLVDRWNRRWIMIFSDSIISIATIVLAVLFAFNTATIWHIYIVMFVRSLAGSFHSNAMSASTSLMVPVENLTRIQGINQMLNGGMNIVSAPLGALLLTILPLQGILAIDVITALIAILPLLFIHIPQPERIESESEETVSRTTVWQDFRAGLHYVLSWPGLVIVGLMTIVINFTIIPAFSLIPLMVKDYFGGNAIQLSWVESAMGIGMLLGGALLGFWGGFNRKIITSLIGLIGMGAGTLVFALAPDTALFMAVGGVFFVGLMSPITIGPFFAVIQTSVAPDMQARVMSLIFSLSGGMAPLGLLIAGPITDQFGIQTWFLVGGLLCIIMGFAGFFIPVLMNIEEARGNVQHAAI